MATMKKIERDFVYKMDSAPQDIINALYAEESEMWHYIARRQMKTRYNADVVETYCHDRLEQVAQYLIENAPFQCSNPSWEVDRIMNQVVSSVISLHQYFHHDPAKWADVRDVFK